MLFLWVCLAVCDEYKGCCSSGSVRLWHWRQQCKKLLTCSTTILAHHVRRIKSMPTTSLIHLLQVVNIIAGGKWSRRLQSNKYPCAFDSLTVKLVYEMNVATSWYGWLTHTDRNLQTQSGNYQGGKALRCLLMFTRDKQIPIPFMSL